MTQQTVAIVGAGLIGCAWGAYYAAKGMKVRFFDVREGYETGARETVRTQLAELPGTDVEQALALLSFHTDLAETVQDVDLVQENGPEKAEFKQQIFADLEKLTREDTLLVSSSSGIPPQVIGANMAAPERAMIGHPFNPPHIIPVVEVCAIEGVPEALVQRLMDFYRDCGRVVGRLKKPVPGFVVNRLQAALVREAMHIVEEGVVDVHELDELMMHSLGVRWASIGPFLTGQLGGGDKGLRGITEHILSGLFTAMELPPVDKATLDRLEEQANRAYPMAKQASFAQVRDWRQKAILDIQNSNPLPTEA